MKVKEYIENHGKSYLAGTLLKAIKKGEIKEDDEIVIGSGLIAPKTPQSNLYKVMKRHNSTKFYVGGRAGRNATSGYYFAVVRG